MNFFDPDKMAETFQLPENEEILTCLALGYPAEGAGPLANHNSRKPIEETVIYYKQNDNDERKVIKLTLNADMHFSLCNECMFSGPAE